MIPPPQEWNIFSEIDFCLQAAWEHCASYHVAKKQLIFLCHTKPPIRQFEGFEINAHEIVCGSKWI